MGIVKARTLNRDRLRSKNISILAGYTIQVDLMDSTVGKNLWNAGLSDFDVNPLILQDLPVLV